MRFLAALLVFVFHVATVFAYPDAETAAGVQSVTGRLAFLGVSFFFVLSGFVLTWSARPGDGAGSFLRRRLCKIYPNHLVTFAVALILLLVLAKPVTGVLPNLLLFHAWIPDQSIFNSVNVVSWSLSCELVFYLFFPLLYRWITRIGEKHLWWWASGVVVAVLCVPFVAEIAIPATDGDPLQAGSSTSQVWFVFIFPPVALLQFVLGILMARIVLAGRWFGLPLPVAALALVGGYALALLVPYNFGINATTIVPIALVIAAGAVADVRGRRTLLRGRTMLWLGEVSFAFYLVHYVVLLDGRELLGLPRLSVGGEVALSIAGFAVSLALAFLLYLGVERPVMRRWSRARRPRHRRAPGRTGFPPGHEPAGSAPRPRGAG
ncbi:hypothetical protein BAY61_23735 [Prauserella marina]|uniref:Peptidoglycan/LPS O-acetylase OafA/YrhL, contains acyltransferase and SGNH-hydrolase domains n=2 Tax=Prauserella marina TaxID=530584 RepID=A0A222VU89_9PSEU|nr:hypothetical protein BAY61_23735 [Prauserella marina]PWV75403.1 peptidoglycan/LPS O-acetylase OafA/YrhL [Prauserella marina]SDD35395.1 Peptidoglycan/LPS O-acetylase OafA/YrhL, contains acyltransferase and SGNH-hydrolase domains [Prauserella marina]